MNVKKTLTGKFWKVAYVAMAVTALVVAASAPMNWG